MNNFVEQYTIPHDVCDHLVRWYEGNKHEAKDGECGSGVQKTIKDSKDLTVHPTYDEEPFLKYKTLLHEHIKQYSTKYHFLNEQACRFGLVEPLIIQKYPINGGYKAEHAEKAGFLDKTLKRCLVWMTYLNDVDDGGTEFIYQNVTYKAIKGNTLIFPAEWTHMHKGQISKTKEKIIITGWYSHLWDIM